MPRIARTLGFLVLQVFVVCNKGSVKGFIYVYGGGYRIGLLETGGDVGSGAEGLGFVFLCRVKRVGKESHISLNAVQTGIEVYTDSCEAESLVTI